ncbi:MAG: branched-chain amino acid ABC transporter permease [Desulfobacterales bacterium]|nr:branched-chain amino acid ABC transporter permease [Desulfobacterales bacterium]
MYKTLFSKKSTIICIMLLVILLLLPQVLSRFYIYLFALVFSTGLLATSLNMVLGFGGMYQFHHAVFYGFGAYVFALLATKSGLPLWTGYLLAPVCSALLGFGLGLITIRLSKLYFGMLQISLGSLVWAIVYRWYSFTGGDDGIHGIPVPDLIGSSTSAYYFTLIVTTLCLALMYMIINSPFGRTFQGIRDNPERCRAIGVNVQKQQLVGQMIAGFFAGVAGTLFVTVEGSVFPELMFWTLSLEILIMCLLGGWFIFLGPMFGTGIMVFLRTFVGIYTEYWTLVLGIVLMLLIFFLPEGVLGLFTERSRIRDQKVGEEG